VEMGNNQEAQAALDGKEIGGRTLGKKGPAPALDCPNGPLGFRMAVDLFGLTGGTRRARAHPCPLFSLIVSRDQASRRHESTSSSA
jgi:hypothetical protein